MLVSTFNLPLCAIPITNSLIPSSAPASMIASKAGIVVSAPSSEKRF